MNFDQTSKTQNWASNFCRNKSLQNYFYKMCFMWIFLNLKFLIGSKIPIEYKIWRDRSCKIGSHPMWLVSSSSYKKYTLKGVPEVWFTIILFLNNIERRPFLPILEWSLHKSHSFFKGEGGGGLEDKLGFLSPVLMNGRGL